MKRLKIMLPIVITLILSLTFSVVPTPRKAKHAPAKKVRREKTISEEDRGVMMALTPPDLSLPLTVNAVAGKETTFKIQARGHGNQQIELQAGNIRNGNLSELHDGSATFSFTPDESQTGTAFIIFTAKDQYGLATSLATKITVSSRSANAIPPDISQAIVTNMPSPDTVITVPVVPVDFPSMSDAGGIAVDKIPGVKGASSESKKVTAPVNTVVGAADVISAGSKGLVTVDVKPTQPDKGVAATQNLPVSETNSEVKTDGKTETAADSRSVKTGADRHYLTDAQLRELLRVDNVAGKSSVSQKSSDQNSTDSTNTTTESSQKNETTRTVTPGKVVKADTANNVVLTPMAGETFNAGDSVMLAWFAPETSQATEQEIQLSTDGGKTYDVVIDPHVTTGIQFFNWTVPSGIDSQNARIRIVMRDDLGVETDTDSSEFSIKPSQEKSSVSLLNLNGNETLVGGRTFNVRWKTDGVFQPLGYDLTLMVGTKQFFRVSSEIAGDAHQFTLNVPNDINTRHARIQLNAYNVAGQPIPVMSTGEFNIVPEPSVGSVDLTQDLEPIGTNLVFKGSGFVSNDSVVELNGVAQMPAYSKSDKQGITDQMNLKIDDLDKTLPTDTIVTITVLNRSTGVRSLPYLYMRPAQ